MRSQANTRPAARQRSHAAVVVAASAALAARAFAQQAPTQNKGVTVKSTTIVELGPEIEGVTGLQLQLRTITLDPSGVYAIHNHRDRPALEIVSEARRPNFAATANATW